MNEAVIVAAKRTAIGKVGGMFKDIPPEQLAAEVIKAIVTENQLHPEDINEVILGNAVGPGGNIARLSLLAAGLPFSVPGFSVDRQCGSGLEAINLAARLIQAGAGDVYLAGGVESSSLAPWKIEKPTSLYGPASPKIFTRARFSTDEIGDPEMGLAAENVAEYYKISREDQDLYSLESHRKAIRSLKTGRFTDEIVSIQDLKTDECPRENTGYEKLQKLAPIFKENGTVTAGNSCPINDGAAVVLLMSKKKCESLGLKPLFRFVDAESAGVSPHLLGIGPVPAVQKLLERRNMNVAEIDVIEFNEAFASQVLASLRELSIPQEKVNRGGGALALGHPYGASGAILITRLCAEMVRSSATLGLATLGIGGGLGIATLIERVVE
ncbi:thiolase family protein [Schinkia sp. CFF1]